jgi:hypothetical protein
VPSSSLPGRRKLLAHPREHSVRPKPSLAGIW